MRKPKGDLCFFFFFFGWRRFLHLLLAAVFLCVISISVELPKLLKSQLIPVSTGRPSTIASRTPLDDGFRGGGGHSERKPFMGAEEGEEKHRALSQQASMSEAFLRSRRTWSRSSERNSSSNRDYGRIPRHIRESKSNTSAGTLSGLERMANEAWVEGFQLWRELHQNLSGRVLEASEGAGGVLKKEKRPDVCPHSMLLSKEEVEENGRDNELFPCGLMSGSSITVVGTPLPAHLEKLTKAVTNLSDGRQTSAMVSQFIVELRGSRATDAEDPPRILHVNPRLRGDWSGKSIFEVNTCYRGQWGLAQRCNGLDTRFEPETVDGLRRCERWVLDEEKEKSKEAVKPASLLNRLMGFSEKSSVYWSYPFLENQSFVMTIRAGWEGYHMSVDGRHIASSPYRTGFSLEDATGLAVKGDIEVHSVLVTSLPTSRPTHEATLELQETLKMPQPSVPFDFFIGILSAANHFAERMAIRKTWMQSKSIKSSKVVARFFIALHASKDVNVQLKREADFYRDIVIVPFLDRYELLVLKTIAICEYAIQNTSAKYVMKCDDDNFVRVETVVDAVKVTGHERGLYMGNINLGHRPLRTGKWAVTFEDWPEEGYPPYANGPGYIVTRDIAEFIVSEHANNTLRIFKMEDVSMGMWVVQYNLWHQVHYEHSFKFCQFGCIDEYYTAHYQSPHHMVCMWEKLSQGKAECCI